VHTSALIASSCPFVHASTRGCTSFASASMPTAALTAATASVITRDAAAARLLMPITSRLIHQPLTPSTHAMPATNAPATGSTWSAPPNCAAPTANKAACDTVSNDSAKSAPTAAMPTG
jgi:hypothetical protein